MDRASAEEKARKAAAAEASKKRPVSASGEGSDSKRQKLEPDTSAAFLAGFDFTSLPVALITELVVANLQAFTEPTLHTLVQTYRDSRAPVLPPAKPASIAEPEPTASAASAPSAPAVKQEPIDPLKMDIDEEEMEYEPDRLNMEVSQIGYLSRTSLD